MPLKRITLNDRERLIAALELSYVELEEYGFLYQLCEELEDREDRLGVDILTGLRSKLTEVETLVTEIETLKTSNGGANNVAGVTKSVQGEYSYSQQTSGMGMVAGEWVLLGSPLASLLSRKETLVKDIHRMLNAYRRQDSYPWGYYNQSTQSLNLG